MGAIGLTRTLEGTDRVDMTLRRILKGSLQAGASDVHLRAGRAPMVRLEGQLRRLEHPDLDAPQIARMTSLLAQWAGVDDARLEQRQCDFACEVGSVGRFRVHAYRESNACALAMRAIPSPIPDFATLRVPPVVKSLANLQRGLILVAGATGNGKSTTIASLLERVNHEHARHIVTVESPVEFLFDERQSTFSLREIGRDVDDTESGLYGALREDPDWIFVSEIRNGAELELALGAAEAGHVVISSLHASDATRAIHRMIHFYPQGRRDAVRHRLADSLAAIICQRLVVRRGSPERILAAEILMRSPTVSDCIRHENRLKGLSKALEVGTSEYGTQTFDQQLLRYVRDGVVELDTARAAASHPNDLARAAQMSGRR